MISQIFKITLDHITTKNNMNNNAYTAIIGLGSMGMGMANSCLAAGLMTWGFDIDPQKQQDFLLAGGQPGGITEVASELNIVVLVMVNSAQMNSVLFGDHALAPILRPGTVILGCPTMSPDDAKDIDLKLSAMGLHYLDSPISGGSAKAANGALTIMASGSDQAFGAAQAALDAMSEKVFRLGDQIGQGSAMKVVNQLLAGVHIASTAEAITFGLKQGIPAEQILQVITQCAGNSWMFENRGAHIVDGDYTPHSSVEIFVKDLGIVSEIARASRSYTPLAAAALQEFLAASGSGLGNEDDSAVAKVYARNSDVDLPKK